MKSISRKNQNGSSLIEFAIGFPLFWICCVAWIEINYLAYVSSTVDKVISEASRVAKKSDKDYLQVLSIVVESESQKWGGVLDAKKFCGSIHYLSSLEDIIRGDEAICGQYPNFTEQGKEEGSPIALYTVAYEHRSVFSHFSENLNGLLKREIIAVQEYERDKFNI